MTRVLPHNLIAYEIHSVQTSPFVSSPGVEISTPDRRSGSVLIQEKLKHRAKKGPLLIPDRS
jgi:hypothetical protein